MLTSSNIDSTIASAQGMGIDTLRDLQTGLVAAIDRLNIELDSEKLKE